MDISSIPNDAPQIEPIEREAGADSCVNASAPGRVEFIGNHTDYNGGWVLGSTIDRRVHVRLTPRDDQQISLESTRDVPAVHGSLADVTKQSGGQSWANYVLGVLSVLRNEGLVVDKGMDIQVQSELPVGAGLSSSAALELATAFALNDAFGGGFDRRELAHLSQRAENDFVGVPCGFLDQAVVAFGAEDRLVCVDARSDSLDSVPFPAETGIWIFQTHQAHALADSGYQKRHDESRSALSRLQERLGETAVQHLVDVTPSQLAAVREDLPETLYRRARHVSTEHRRVERAIRLLEERRYEAVGALLFASHESSRLDYENSTPELDFLVDQLRDREGVLGARLTGAGFGGAVMAWTNGEFGRAGAEAVALAYEKTFGEGLEPIAGHPAPGAIVHQE
jgi:galactokinase